jgi:hypothetical protein
MGHSLNRTSFRINQNLVIDDKTFNPGYILISDIYGNAGWKNPNQYISNEEPLDRFIGELYGGGIVVAVWREQRETLYEICLIASVKNYSVPFSEGEYFYFQWSNIGNLAIGATARSHTFGASNSISIIGQGSPITGDAAKAASKCAEYINEDLYGLGVYGDWYLPSTFEINCLANNAAIFDRVISQYAVDKSLSLAYDDTTGAFSKMDLFVNANASAGNIITGYWTSTEFNAGSAHFLNMAGAGVRFDTASKSSYKHVRPFRQDVKRWNGITWVQDRNKTGKILIVYDQPAPAYATSSPGGGMVANITTTEVSLGNTVTVISSYSSIPANLSQYDHIWDINVQEGGGAVQTLLVPTGAAAKYTTYLQQGGGLFILGENAQNYTPRNNDLASFITNIGGGNIQTTNESIYNSLNIESEFLIANNRNTVSFLAIGRFSSIGTGSPITRNPIDSLTGQAVVWKTGSLSLAPKGAIVVVLDFNFLSSDYASAAPFYSKEFVANVSLILNKS